MAEHGQPVVITPFTLMGAMAPVTLAAALAQQNAEVLFGVVLAQAVQARHAGHVRRVHVQRRHAFRRACVRHARECKSERRERPTRTSLSIALSHIERERLERRRCAGRVRDADVALGRGARRRQPRLSRGGMAGGRAYGFVREVHPRCRDAADDDGVPRSRSSWTKPSLGFDAISRVQTGGHFFGDPHTMERYEHAFYQPLVSNWQNYENWELAGAKDATQRATDIWQRALQEYEQPAMEPAIRRRTRRVYREADARRSAAANLSMIACTRRDGAASTSAGLECPGTEVDRGIPLFDLEIASRSRKRASRLGAGVARRDAQARVRRHRRGGGGHGLATAYYLAKVHGARNVAVVEKGWIGGGNVGRNTTIIRSNYLMPGNIPFYEWSMKLWEGLEQDINYNAMVSQRGVLNLFHSDAQRDAALRRGNSMRMHGVDGELLECQRSPAARSRMVGFRQRAVPDPWAACCNRRGGTVRHDAVAWGFARAAEQPRRRHHPELRSRGHPPRRRRRGRRRNHARLHRQRGASASPVPATPLASPRSRTCACRSKATCCRRS